MKSGIIYFIIGCIFFSSCSTSTSPNPNNTNPVIRYEIILPGQIIAPVNPSYNVIVYTNETGQTASLTSNFTSGNRWTKTVTLTATTRPLFIQFHGLFPYTFCNTVGPIVSNIYVNNVLKASLTQQPINGSISSTTGVVQYTLQ